MKKILYVVSTLGRSGPTNQLFNIVQYLDRSRFEVYLITLSAEPEDSRWDDYAALGVKLASLKLSRLKSFLLGKKKLEKMVRNINPDLIHTQGIRADHLVSNMGLMIPCVITVHNFAPEDYSMKFGWLKSKLMVAQHFRLLRKADNLVACSKTISCKLDKVGIRAKPIQNGVTAVMGDIDNVSHISSKKKPIFMFVGNLIPRKNVMVLIKAFNALPADTKGTLVVVGDGPLMTELKAVAGESIIFLGSVSNVPDYLAAADYFVSASLSEGLPIAVLESLFSGVPVILSDIESHAEIASASPAACKLFSLDGGMEELSKVLSEARLIFDSESKSEAKRVARDVFSAERMSTQYQDYYRKVINYE